MYSGMEKKLETAMLVSFLRVYGVFCGGLHLLFVSMIWIPVEGLRFLIIVVW